MRRFPGLLASALLLVGSASHAATVEGRVTLKPPSAAPVVQPRYPVAATYTVRDPDPPPAIVHVEGDFPDAAGVAAPADVAQQGCQFAPGLLAVRRGGGVRFPNLDDEYHSGGEAAWDNDRWRADLALTWRMARHLQAKIEYDVGRQRGDVQQGEQLLAMQLTLKF